MTGLTFNQRILRRGAWQLKRLFNPSARPSPAEIFLEQEGIPFRRRCDGSVYVKEPIYLNDKGLERLPDLSNVVLDASFYCQNNQLSSLRGAPQIVTGGFFAQSNALVTLDGAPTDVGAAFYCQQNRLETLAHAPRRVGSFFDCADNLLTTLDGGPENVGHTYHCARNRLQSLGGAEGARQKILSDFGEFASWQDVPEDVRYTADEKETLITRSTVLDAAIRVSRTLVLKR